MRKFAFYWYAVLLGVFVLSAAAQDKSAILGRVFIMSAKPGMSKQFEEGRKRHMDWHRKQNDTWEWLTWQIETGPNAGSYLSTTFGHTWADFDSWEGKLGMADTADVETNVGPYSAGGDNGIWLYMKEDSRPPDDSTPWPLADVEHYILKPGATRDFGAAIKKINEAIDKSKWPAHYYWYSLVNGGEAPHYVLVIPSKNWAGMADPEPPFPAMLESALGRHDAESVMHNVDHAIQRQWNELVRYRGDLSYRPSGK